MILIHNITYRCLTLPLLTDFGEVGIDDRSSVKGGIENIFVGLATANMFSPSQIQERKRSTCSFLRYFASPNCYLYPVSRVTGIPGWYWILGIKCCDTTGVGLLY